MSELDGYHPGFGDRDSNAVKLSQMRRRLDTAAEATCASSSGSGSSALLSLCSLPCPVRSSIERAGRARWWSQAPVFCLALAAALALACL